MNQSTIEHKANMYYVEFREDFLLLCQGCSYKKSPKSKASPHCKALILAILEHWTNDKRGRGDDLFVFMSYQQWIDEMYGMFGRTVIIDSLDELIGEDLISRQPYKMYGRDTFKYLLHIKTVNERLRALPDRDPQVTRPQVNGSTSKRDTPTNGRDPSTSKRETRPQVNGSHSQVDVDPSTSNHNIESILESTQTLCIDSTQQHVYGAAGADTTTSTPDSLLDKKSVEETPSPLAAPKTRMKPAKKRPEKVDLLASASLEARAVVTEWQAQFKLPSPATTRLIEHAETLALFQPSDGEIAACRLWMYQTDKKGWYRTHGMHLGDVAREFEKFRSLASMPKDSAGFTVGSRRISSFDDPNYTMEGEFYPDEQEKKARREREAAASVVAVQQSQMKEASYATSWQ